MTTLIIILLLISIATVLGAAAWWGWNWWSDWPTRLKRRLPEPPLGYVWMLQTQPTYSATTYTLALYDVLNEKQVNVRSVTRYFGQRMPDSFDMRWMVESAEQKVSDLTPVELRDETRFL